ETPEVLIDFLRLVQRGLQAQVKVVRTDEGAEFLNQTLHVYFAAEGIQHQTSVARTPEQNGSRAFRVFNKRTRVIMESIHVNFDELPQMASDQISSDPVPECQTMVLNHDSLCPAIQRQANVSQVDRTVKISNELDLLFSPMFDELLNGSFKTMALNHDILSLGRKCQENVSHGDKTVTTLNELDLLFSPMFDELLNGPSQVVSKSSAVTTANESIRHQQQQSTSLVNHTTPTPTCQIPSTAPTVISSENINQAKTHAENDQVANYDFINVFSTPVQDQGETSSRHVDSSNMHTFYQRYPSEHRWTKDHPLEQVIGNPSQSVRTRRQL
nr:hypothetical protein [Tanacetum cinerariifolium]